MPRRNPAEFDELYKRFTDAVIRLDDEMTARAASLVFMAGHYLAPVVLREKQIPSAEAKSFAATVREFGRARVPKDLAAWLSKNRRALEQLVHSASWPDKGTSTEQTAHVDRLVVHNQTGDDISANLKLVRRARMANSRCSTRVGARLRCTGGSRGRDGRRLRGPRHGAVG